MELVSKAKIIGAIGAVLLFAGIYGIYGAVSGMVPESKTGTSYIPAGAEWYLSIHFGPHIAGHVSGDFTVQTIGTVTMYILDQSDFESFRSNGRISNPIASATESSGTYSADLAMTESTYVVFVHGEGYSINNQTIQFHYLVSGMNPLFLIGGTISLVVGVVVILFSMRMKKRTASSEAVTQPKPADVILFSDGKPPAK